MRQVEPDCIWIVKAFTPAPHVSQEEPHISCQSIFYFQVGSMKEGKLTFPNELTFGLVKQNLVNI